MAATTCSWSCSGEHTMLRARVLSPVAGTSANTPSTLMMRCCWPMCTRGWARRVRQGPRVRQGAPAPCKPLTLDLAQKVFSWEREAGEWQHQADEERMYQDMAHQALAEKEAELTECKKALADLQAFLAFKKQEEADLEEEEMQRRAANVGKHGGWMPKMAHMCALVFCKRWKEVEAKAWEHYGTNATFKLVCDKEYYKLP
jgi:hypothetical protein